MFIITTFLWIFDHYLFPVTGSQICWTVFILSSRILSSEVFTALWGVSHEDRNPVMQKGKNIILRGCCRHGYRDNQFIYYSLSPQVLLYRFHCIVFPCKRSFSVCVSRLHELLACVCVFTCAHSRQWRVWRPESFPGSPSCPTLQGPGWGALWLPGTRPSSAMKAHGPKHTTEAESHSTPQDAQRIIFILKVMYI